MFDPAHEAREFAMAWYGIERGADALRLAACLKQLLKRAVEETNAEREPSRSEDDGRCGAQS